MCEDKQFLGASELKSYPPEVGTVMGKVRPTSFVSSTWPSFPPVWPSPRETVRQQQPHMPFPARTSSKVFQNLGTSHPFALTQRPKVTEEAPTPRERRELRIQ